MTSAVNGWGGSKGWGEYEKQQDKFASTNTTFVYASFNRSQDNIVLQNMCFVKIKVLALYANLYANNSWAFSSGK